MEVCGDVEGTGMTLWVLLADWVELTLLAEPEDAGKRGRSGLMGRVAVDSGGISF